MELKATSDELLSKVPEVTLLFWVIKIAATTFGETAGDAVSMSLNLGYLIGTLIFAVIFVGAVVAQIAAREFRPFLYWATIIASTTVGTTLADFVDRSLGIGYAGGTTLLIHAAHDVAVRLVSNARLDIDRYREFPKVRDVLLGDDHVLPDAGHGPWRLDRRHRGPRLYRRVLSCSARCWRLSLRRIYGPTSLGLCCSGRRSC